MKTAIDLRRDELLALIALAVLAALAAVAALSFPMRARIYPIVVSITSMVLAGVAVARLYMDARAAGAPHEAVTGPSLRSDLGRAVTFLMWFAGYYGIVFLIGLVTASSLFVTLFLGKHGKVRWVSAVVVGLAVGVTMAVLGALLNLRWPTSVVDPFMTTGLFR